MKTSISHRLFTRITAVALMLVLGFAAALAVSSPAKADEGPANYSFYKLSSSLAAFFSNAQSPDEKAVPLNAGVWNSVITEPGNAGSMLGYVDPDFSFSMEFLNSQISGSSAAVGYSTLFQSSQGSDERSTKTPGMLDYAHFGAALNALGLDSMGTGLSLGFIAPVGGGLIMLLYIFTGVVDLLFTGIIEMLKILNPFKLFYEGVRAVNPEFATGMTGGQAPPGFLGGLSSWIGDWYQVLNGLAWTVLVPLFIGILLLGLVLSKNMNRGSALKKLFIRLLFIGVGLPLIGSMYTGVLNSMGDATKSGTAGSTQVVLSTYVDFQNWAYKNRLMVPENADIGWNATENKPTASALANVRKTALEINKSTNSAWGTIHTSWSDQQDASWTNAAISDMQGDNAGGVNGYMSTIDMLGRYIKGAKLDAASYETAVKGDISTSAPYTGDADGKKQVSEWFTRFGDPEKTLPEIEDPGVVMANPVLSVATGRGLQASPAGATTGDKRFNSPSQWGCQVWVSDNSGNPLNCNMSTLSIYNYLNTSFGPDSMTIYSSNKATSGATREMHNSVTQVGTGTMSALYWFNAVVLLASFVIIGMGYALSMLFSNIKRGIQLMTAIPFATIGAIPGIAKVLVYATAMILEVILTLFLYRFIQTFLISIPQIVELPFAAVLNNSDRTAASINLLLGGTLPMVMTVLSIITLILFTILALRIRKTVVKAVQEVVTKLVDKFMDTSIAPPGGKGSMAPALAGGLASGAGMAAANRAMGGRSGSPAGKASNHSGEGPSGISAGGIPQVGGPGPDAGGPAGELTVGGGADMDVSGAIGEAGPDGSGPDGSGGRPGGGGSGGTPPGVSPAEGPTAALRADSQDRALASSVQAQGGLSEAGSRGSGDVTDTLAGSVDKTRSQYAAKDKAVADGAVSGGKAVAKGAEAAGRGMAGDAPGAVSAGAAAAGHAQNSQASAQRAKSLKKDIDSPASVKSSQSAASAAAPARTASQQKPQPASGASRTAMSQKSVSAQGSKPSAAATGVQGAKPAAASRSGVQVPNQAPAPTPAVQAPKQAPAPKPVQAPAPRPAGPAKPVSGPRMAPAPRVAPAPRAVSAQPQARPVQGAPAQRPGRKEDDA